MRSKTILFVCFATAVTLLISACGSAVKNDAKQKPKYPEKEITIIVPWSAGGSSDLLARALARAANKTLEKPIIVVNRDGAGGGIATSEVARSKPDGYTAAIGASGLFTTQPFLKKVDYQISDFDFLIGISNEPVLLTVPADSPDKTLGDFIQRAKAGGKVVKYGNSGIGTVPHLCLAYFFQLSGVNAQPVPYKSNAPALAALMGGHLDVSAAHPGEAIPQIKAGKIRALAISSTKRFDALPDVPTMQEMGYKVDMGVKKFVMAPKGMPANIRMTLSRAFEKASADPEFVKAMKDMYLALDPMDGIQVNEYLNKEAPLMKKLIAEISVDDSKKNK